MKKAISPLILPLVLTILSSCASSQTVTTLADLNGEWDIIQIDQTAIVPAPGQAFPYLGLDTTTGRVWGNSGCNLLTGTATIDTSTSRISFGEAGSTRMLCPDMKVEETILAALSEVKHYHVLDDGCLLFYAGSKKNGMVLRRRESNR